jgi:broad specificity phosphatase PhoE
MNSHPTIVFVRHGETDWNAEGRLQGQRDIPLNALGRDQARRNGEVIAKMIPEAAGFDFVASPLSRARETIEIVRLAMGLDPEAYRTDPRLVEVSFGHWEGFTNAEVEDREPGSLAHRERDKWGFLPPGGESYDMLSMRVLVWLATLIDPSVIVAHGGVGRVLRRHLLGLDRTESVTENFPQDRVFLWKDGAGAWL